MDNPTVVLLIGGIASGKSFVSDYFASMGAHIIDTDILAKNLTDPTYSALSQQVLLEIQSVFGVHIVSDSLVLNRKALRDLIFFDQTAKKTLERILHPKINLLVQKALTENKMPYTIIVVPVIDQASSYLALVDQVLDIEVPVNIQLQRLLVRDNISVQLAQKIIAAQISNGERRLLANTIVVNTHITHTERKLLALHNRYQSGVLK